MTRSNLHRLGLIALFVLLLSPALSVFAHDEPSGPAGKPLEVSSLGQAAIGIKVEVVDRKSMPMEVSVPGKIEVIPTRQFDQHAPLSGRIESVTISPGEMVKEGRVLAVLTSPEMNQLAAQLLQTRLDIESQIASQQATSLDEVRQAQEKFELAEANYNRTKKLNSMKIAAEKDVIAAESEYEIANSRLKAATTNKNIMQKTLRARLELTLAPIRQRLEMLGVNESEIEDMLKQEKTLTEVPIKAARSGFVTNIAASPGKNIDPSVSLFTIADLTKVWATADVYEEDMSRMRIGQPVHVMVHALQGEHLKGTLTYIGTQVDPQTRTLPVRAEIANTEFRLKPDMFADLFIETANSGAMIAVPRNAVIPQGARNVVFLETKEGYQPQYVTTGQTLGSLIEVTHGLEPGDRLVTQGAFQLSAEMVKNSGGEALFAPATEGERIDTSDEGKAGGPLSLNVQTVVVIVAVAFILGFAVSAVFLFKGKGHKQDETAHLDPEHPGGPRRPESTGPSSSQRGKSDHV